MMKSRFFIGFAIAGFFILACQPPPAIKPDSRPETIEPAALTEAELLTRANELFLAQSYEEALEFCHQYLFRFPGGSLTPEILMRAGAIHMALDRYAEARADFQRLITTFPDSPLVPEARISTLAAFYKEGAYERVIQGVIDLADHPFQTDQLARIYLLLGNSRMAMGAPMEAVLSYSMAHGFSTIGNRPRIVNHLKMAVRLLAADEIELLLHSMDDEVARALLLHQLGLRYFEAGKYEEAGATFEEFLQFFPGHEYGSRAENLLAVIRDELAFKGVAIGCLFPLTGASKIFGERALNGVELALNRLAGREDADSIKIVIRDTASNPETVGKAVQELVDARVSAIIGPFHFTAESAAEKAQELETPIITLTQKDRITERGAYVFRHFITPEMQVRTLASHAMETLGFSRFAILYPDGKYGRKYMNLFWDETLARGGRVVGLEQYDPSRTDFADSIKKLVGLYHEVPADLVDLVYPRRKEPPRDASGKRVSERIRSREEEEEGPPALVDFEAVFIPDKPSRAGLIIPQLAYYDIDGVQLLGTNLWHSDKMIEMARPYVQGAVMPELFFAESASPMVTEFVALHETIHGERPGFIEAVTYDTANMLFTILGHPDARVKSAVKDRLTAVRDVEGVTGSITMDAGGNAEKNLYLLEIQGTSFVEVEDPAKPSPSASPGASPILPDQESTPAADEPARP